MKFMQLIELSEHVITRVSDKTNFLYAINAAIESSPSSDQAFTSINKLSLQERLSRSKKFGCNISVSDSCSVILLVKKKDVLSRWRHGTMTWSKLEDLYAPTTEFHNHRANEGSLLHLLSMMFDEYFSDRLKCQFLVTECYKA